MAGALWIAATALLAASPFDRYLVGRWDFKAAGLSGASDHPLLLKRGVGADPYAEVQDGYLQIGAGTLMSAQGVGSLFPKDDGDNVTLWAQLTMDESPSRSAYALGLTQGGQSGGNEGIILGLYCLPGEIIELRAFARLGQLIPNSGRDTTTTPAIGVEAGVPLTVALVFNGREKKMTLFVNGEHVTREIYGKGQGALRLQDFDYLSVGRLFSAGGSPLKVKELRLYSVAIPDNWLGEL